MSSSSKSTVSTEIISSNLKSKIDNENIIISDKSGADLTALLENMPINEKYTLLLQSYCKKILEMKSPTAESSKDLVRKMDTLYYEMIQKSIPPEKSASQSLLDASASFCNVDIIGKALRLGKASGALNVFGVAIGQLTTPITRKVDSSLLNIDIPQDDREREIFNAGLITVLGSSWALLEVLTKFNDDIHPWVTLYSVFILALGGLDVAYKQGLNIRQAVAGFDRLILRDAERESHCDGSAFLIGYLLGLPCFCYKPDVIEALKMTKDAPLTLSAYKQPKALKVKSSIGGLFNDLKKGFVINSKNDKLLPKESGSSISDLDIEFDIYSETDDPKKEGLLGLGRILIWLMAPVAAEQLKYGKTVISDPRRCQRLFQVLDSIQKSVEKEENKSSNNNDNNKSVSINEIVAPLSTDDRLALMGWAYFEATSLIRQYGDLLEEVSSFMRTGTSTVGECTLMVEQELTI
eukprot:gene5444-7537_t